MPSYVTLVERLERKSIPEPNSGCWLWLGAVVTGKKSGPYGVTNRTGEQRSILAHRASYEVYIGAIPDKMQIDHTCQNTFCINPEHLEAVTSKEHCRRTVMRWLGGKCQRGHLMDVKNTWVEKTGYGHCRRCHADNEARKRAARKVELSCSEVR